MGRKNLDALVNAPPQAVAEVSFRVIDAIQDDPRMHVQAAGVASAFLLLCERLKLNAQEVFTAANNVLHDERHGGSKHFSAVRDYIHYEITS
jgi:hypothetical protein